VVASGLTAGTTVGLASAGTVTQTPPIIASSLAILSADSVSLGGDLNWVGTLAAKVMKSGASFVFRDDGTNLTIGTVGSESTGTLLGVITNGGNIILETTTSGNLVLNQPVNANGGSLGLASAGTITQSMTGVIVASEVEILSKERVSLGAFVGPTEQGAPH